MVIKSSSDLFAHFTEDTFKEELGKNNISLRIHYVPGIIWLFAVVQLCPTLYDPTDYSMPDSLSFTISWSLLKLMSMESGSVPQNCNTRC